MSKLEKKITFFAHLFKVKLCLIGSGAKLVLLIWVDDNFELYGYLEGRVVGRIGTTL